VQHLTRILTDLKEIKGPKLLHVITVKGKGYPYAEKEQTRFHAPGFFDKLTGKSVISVTDKDQPPKYQEVFGKTILELARLNPDIVGITPAMPSGCSLNILMKEIPERGIDVGIAEQHAVTFSAGLAAQGLIPFCNIYSSFFQRAYDQVIHDVALQKLPVVFCLDRAGLVGEDGATHHGAFDLSFLRCIPNLTIAAPINEEELRNLMFTAQKNPAGPLVIRYPRGNGVLRDWQRPFAQLPIGKGQQLLKGNQAAIVSIGHLGNFAMQAARELKNSHGLSIAVFDMRFLKPFDEELLHQVFSRFNTVITIEDNALAGGMGSSILEFMSDHGYQAKVRRLGIPDYFVEQGSLEELYAECGYDVEGIKKAILNECQIYLKPQKLKNF
jgi:1-deoxy-D-xylulose-5-phosphate synthase